MERSYGICMDRPDPDSSEGFSRGTRERHIVHVYIDM